MHELLVSIKLAFNNLRSNIGRTLLSLLGIVIGVASVILVLSFGSGVKNFVTSQISSFGTDIIQIEVKVPKVSQMSSANANGQVGGTTITTFKLDDARRVAKLDNVDSWYAMFVPVGTPQIIVDTLYKATVKVLAEPAVKEKLIGQGAEAVGSTPAQLGAIVKAELVKWKKVTKESGIKAE